MRPCPIPMTGTVVAATLVASVSLPAAVLLPGVARAADGVAPVTMVTGVLGAVAPPVIFADVARAAGYNVPAVAPGAGSMAATTVRYADGGVPAAMAPAPIRQPPLMAPLTPSDTVAQGIAPIRYTGAAMSPPPVAASAALPPATASAMAPVRSQPTTLAPTAPPVQLQPAPPAGPVSYSIPAAYTAPAVMHNTMVATSVANGRTATVPVDALGSVTRSDSRPAPQVSTVMLPTVVATPRLVMPVQRP